MRGRNCRCLGDRLISSRARKLEARVRHLIRHNNIYICRTDQLFNLIHLRHLEYTCTVFDRMILGVMHMTL